VTSAVENMRRFARVLIKRLHELRMRDRLRALALEDFMDVALDWVEALEACRARGGFDASTLVVADTNAGNQKPF